MIYKYNALDIANYIIWYANENRKDIQDITNLKLQKLYDNVKHIQDQKEYALKVKDTPFSSIMFIAKKLGDCNILQVFNKQDTQLKTKILSKVV